MKVVNISRATSVFCLKVLESWAKSSNCTILLGVDVMSSPPVNLTVAPGLDSEFCMAINSGFNEVELTASENVREMVFELRSNVKLFNNGRTLSGMNS